MARPLTSHKRALTLSTIVFLLSLAVVAFTGVWWPGIMLAIGLALALRQYLLGRTYDTMVSLLVFGGTFITVQFDISWRIFLPILFTLGAIYILVREFFDSEVLSEDEQEEDINREIDEKKK